MADISNDALFINRELSWLDFNRRVLALASEDATPLGERLKFTAIYTSNLDEFFMIRVGSLYDQTLLKKEIYENKTKMSAQQQIDAIMPKVAELQLQCDDAVNTLHASLVAQGMNKVNFSQIEKPQQQFWKKYFSREMLPVLSPQIVDKRHPFPFLRNMEIYVGAFLTEKKNGTPVFGLIPVSNQFERLIFVEKEDGQQEFALVEELILHFASTAFNGMDVQSKCLFRVTRNADLNMEESMLEHDVDYRAIMSELLKKRRKQAAARLQFFGEVSSNIQKYLLEKLVLPHGQVIFQSAPLELSYMYKLSARLHRNNDAQLFYPTIRPIQPDVNFDLYKQVQQKDVLVYFPYQTMRPFLNLLFQAAVDPDVISIKMTLYRVASDSKIIEALIAAAENGKEVVSIVELRARFDEQNNIAWSRQLEQAGCTVIYGFADYKVHSKLLLITRRKNDHFEYMSAIGTGNYNEKTSELYTDINYLTVNPEIGEEVSAVFNDLAMEQLTYHVDRLVVAPMKFKSVFIQEMQTEIKRQKEHGDGQILFKCNSISDKNMIEMLSKASQANVKITMIVRGICCLKAGVPGLSDNIRVQSIVGRYLEHARIYTFGTGERMRMYIASGDFLTRNTERRVEVGVRIDDEDIKQMLWDVLSIQLKDNTNTSVMRPDGNYVKISEEQGGEKINSHLKTYEYFADKIQLLYAPPAPKPLAVGQSVNQLDTQSASAAPAVVHRVQKKRGFFQRLFGRKANRK